MKVFQTVRDTWMISETTRLFWTDTDRNRKNYSTGGKAGDTGLQWREYSAIAGTV